MILIQKELLQAISTGESVSIEFKTSFQKEVIESAAAFRFTREIEFIDAPKIGGYFVKL